ncbi:hypothetical protein [Frigidibacter oleivorans]|uniref:hypothetical protein n=1 Tax=Frigidibacter oleivorans TaxID=2487129 RepID=UPI000F8EDD94|nr:hypothetical protein [Frigidibacter oleivorans]
MSFHLLGAPDETLRLKSFGSTSKGAKAVIRIEIETSDMWALGHALKELAEVQAGQQLKPARPNSPLALTTADRTSLVPGEHS